MEKAAASRLLSPRAATASPSLSRLNSPNISCLFSHRNTSVIAPFPGFCTFLDAGEAQEVPNLGKRDHISLPPAPSKPDTPKTWRQKNLPVKLCQHFGTVLTLEKAPGCLREG